MMRGMTQAIILTMLLSMAAVAFAAPDAAGGNQNRVTNTAESTAIQQNAAGQNVALGGLQNAMVRVHSNETRDHLERVWSMIRLRQRERFQNFTNMEVVGDSNGALNVTGDVPARFLGFIPVQKRIMYGITDNGNVTRIRGTWDWMFSTPQEVQ